MILFGIVQFHKQ